MKSHINEKKTKKKSVGWGTARIVLYENKDLILELLAKKYPHKLILERLIKLSSVSMSLYTLSKFIRQCTIEQSDPASNVQDPVKQNKPEPQPVPNVQEVNNWIDERNKFQNKKPYKLIDENDKNQKFIYAGRREVGEHKIILLEDSTNTLVKKVSDKQYNQAKFYKKKDKIKITDKGFKRINDNDIEI